MWTGWPHPGDVIAPASWRLPLVCHRTSASSCASFSASLVSARPHVEVCNGSNSDLRLNVCGWKPDIRLAWLSCTGGHLRDAQFRYSLDRLFRVISMYSLSAIRVLTLTMIQNTNKNQVALTAPAK